MGPEVDVQPVRGQAGLFSHGSGRGSETPETVSLGENLSVVLWVTKQRGRAAERTPGRMTGEPQKARRADGRWPVPARGSPRTGAPDIPRDTLHPSHRVTF